MKHFLLLGTLVFFLLTSSCKNKPIHVERLDVTPVVLVKELYMKRVHNLICTDKHLVVTPLGQTEEGFINVYDLNGEAISRVGTIGMGPQEFITPMNILYKRNSIFTWDINRKISAICEIKAGETAFSQEFITLPFIRNAGIIEMQADEKGNFIVYDPKSENIITLYSPEGEILTSAGKLPFPMDIENKEEAYQGSLYYNRKNQRLLLTLKNAPYAAVYKISNSKISLLEEKIIIDNGYTVANKKIIFDSPGKDCLIDCCLTKDYIVSVKNDPDYKGTDNSITSPKRHTVALYDYNLNLIKIVNMHMYRYNLSSFGEDNTFYAISQNPENCIVKVTL